MVLDLDCMLESARKLKKQNKKQKLLLLAPPRPVASVRLEAGPGVGRTITGERHR